MPGASGRHASAVVALNDWLTNTLGGPARRLSAIELRAHKKRSAIEGWRLEIASRDGPRRLDLLTTERFPREPPKLVLIDRPPFLSWPHIELDGLLCLLPGVAAVTPSNPTGVAAAMLNAALQLIEDSATGRNEDEFRDEFLSYWGWDRSEKAPAVYSLVDPRPPSRLVRAWRGEGFTLFGEDDGAVLSWLKNRYDDVKEQPRSTEPGILLWLDHALLPREYPRTGADILRLAQAIGPREAALIETLARVAPPLGIAALLGAPTLHGPCLGGVTIPAPRSDGGKPGNTVNRLTAGFRPGKVPPILLSARFLAATPVLRSSVDRVDPSWIHGRGQDPRFDRLHASTIAILGCGSIGAPVAIMLAEAGVGAFHLADPDALAAANVGRHPLGVASIGANKAEALARRIRTDYPHVRLVEAYAERWEAVAARKTCLLGSCDLVISAIGDWSSEGALNEWHIGNSRSHPIVYGWSEAHACAGHAVAVTANGGCLRCGVDDFGRPAFTISEWPEGRTLRQEPACGAVFQPYGPVELGHIVASVAEVATDALLGIFTTSTHRFWVGRRSLLTTAGGRWSSKWTDIAGDRSQGGCVEERPWERVASCPDCGVP